MMPLMWLWDCLPLLLEELKNNTIKMVEQTMPSVQHLKIIFSQIFHGNRWLLLTHDARLAPCRSRTGVGSTTALAHFDSEELGFLIGYKKRCELVLVFRGLRTCAFCIVLPTVRDL